MRSYAICFISLVGLVLVYGQTTTPTVCWDKTWYNNSAPTATNRSDYETQPASVLDHICPAGKVIEARCKDEKGESFKVFKNDSVNQYIATCSIVTGLICNPYNNSKKLCADFQIQYGCACPTTSTAKATPAPVGGGSAAGSINGTTNTGSGNANHVGSGQGASVSSTTSATGAASKQNGQCGNGAQSYGISLFILMTSIILKVLGC